MKRSRRRSARCDYQHQFFRLAWKLRHNWIPTISNTGIHYLATTSISPSSLSALSLGLNFIPVPSLSQSVTTQSYLEKQWLDFKRRLNIQYFFMSQKPGQSSTYNKFRLPSTWEPNESDFNRPPGYSPLVAQYLQQVKSNLLTMSTTINLNHSTILSRYQNPRWLIPTLKCLHNNKNIIITEADKNMGIVIIDTSDYRQEGLRQLQCQTTYKLIDNISTSLFKHKYALLRIILNRYGYLYKETSYNNQLSDLAKYLLQLEPNHKNLETIHKTAAKFYLLMKMHKSPVVGRPIVSTINSFTYHVSVYVDSELKPLLKLIPSYIESSQQLIHLLETLSFPKDCIICCADIESLYPNIPIDKGIDYVSKAIKRLSFLLPGRSRIRDDNNHLSFILELMTWVLKNNYFMFGNQWYHQLQGTAMGTPLAVPFACLFVCQIEYEIFSCPVSNILLTHPLFYKRYIDDIFYIARSREEADIFFNRFNSIIPTIRCGSLTVDSDTGIFLDIQIYKGSRFSSSNILDFKTYQKEQNRYLYLAPNSFHRRDIFKSVIISELNRYRLTCTDDNDFYRMSTLFYQRLVARGYNPLYLDGCFPCHSTRETLIAELSKRYNALSNTLGHGQYKNIPLLFKTLNTFETSQLNISKLTSIPDELKLSLSSTDKATQHILSENPTTCYCNSQTSYTIVGNARKTLYQR